MNIQEIMKYVSMRRFLPDFCNIEYTTDIRLKMRGKDRNNKKISFSDEEIERINKGRIALNKHITKNLKP